MKQINVPSLLKERYEEEIFKKVKDTACLNQMLKILDYGCIVIIRNPETINANILRLLRKSIIEEAEFYNAVNHFNMFYSRMDNGNKIDVYYAEAETQIFLDGQYLKTISLTYLETLDKTKEETLNEKIFSCQTKYKKNSLLAHLNYNYLFNKYFGKINANFGSIINSKDIENIETLISKQIELDYRRRFFSPEEGHDEAKKNRIINDLENRKNLEIWEINLLNRIIFNTKHIKL